MMIYGRLSGLCRVCRRLARVPGLEVMRTIRTADTCAILGAQSNITVVGEAGNGLQAVLPLCELDVEVVLMDIRMPGVDDVEATRRIRPTIPSASSS
jgi:DNA-binding NarL/FixJ family response regulator